MSAPESETHPADDAHEPGERRWQRAGEVVQGLFLSLLLVAVVLAAFLEGDFSSMSFRYIDF